MITQLDNAAPQAPDLARHGLSASQLAPANDRAFSRQAFEPVVDPTRLFAAANQSRYWEGHAADAPRLVSPSLIEQRQKKYRRAFFALAAAGVDGAAALSALLAADLALATNLGRDVMGMTFVLAAPIFVLAAIVLGSHRVATLFDMRSSLSHAGKAWLAVLLAMPAIMLVTPSPGPHVALVLALAMLAMLPAIVIGRVATRQFGKLLLGQQPYVEVVIEDGFASNLPSHALVFNAKRNGILPDPSNPGSVSKLAELLRNVDLVTVYAHPARRAAWARALRAFDVRVDMRAPELAELAPLGFEYRQDGWQMVVARHPLGLWQAALKRGFDLSAVLVALPLLVIPMAIVAIMIKLDSDGPVLFRQQRVGRGNRMFHIYKFRSMRTDRQDLAGSVSASRDDDRITKVGGWLRRTSIDELPQLLNVLRGEMSLVGPRPHAIASRAEGQLFWEIDAEYWMRHAIKPGLTGLAQVSGYRGATDHRDDLLNRVRSDLAYAQNWSLWADMLILFRTFGVMRHENAY
jgi:polysaccharide biosynthesis protein PslA